MARIILIRPLFQEHGLASILRNILVRHLLRLLRTVGRIVPRLNLKDGQRLRRRLNRFAPIAILLVDRKRNWRRVQDRRLLLHNINGCDFLVLVKIDELVVALLVPEV